MNKQTPTLGKCSVMVADPKGWHRYTCARPATVERDGKLFCSIHDPEYVKRKSEERSAKWRKQFNIDVAGNVAGKACSRINPSNPQAVADQIEAMYKALKRFVDRGTEVLSNYGDGKNKGKTLQELLLAVLNDADRESRAVLNTIESKQEKK
jgi:uncharacterized Zn finger protein (UPF0148 family)